jgi:CheY-like chemotaxis protein
MNGVIGMTELVLGTDLRYEQRDMLESARLSAESLLCVINDVLDFSKIEANKLEIDATDFGLRECLENTLKALAVRAHEKGLELACRIESDVPEYIVGDPLRLRQIITNLVHNAIKFTERGEVLINVKIAIAGDNARELHISAKDTGCGVPEDKQGAIFQAFTQADGSTTRQFGGTGLGLTISSQLAQLMGGRIWLESEVEKGSTFHVTLPLHESQRRTLEPSLLLLPELRNVNVLVVDDNLTNRRILSETLRRWGCKTTVADGAQSAIEAIQKARKIGKQFSLILTDAQMPGQDGFELIESIRREPGLTQPAIMMLTSIDHDACAGRCRDLGISGYLTKPIRQVELHDAILRALGKAETRVISTAPLANEISQAERPRMRVLLAEDNAVNQRLATALLRKLNCDVVTASNGLEVLAELKKASFDVVLMDVQMPLMDGLEAAARIRQQEVQTGSHLPIIALTAYAMRGDRERCLQAGMDKHISKPIRPAELTSMINSLLLSREVADLQPAPADVVCT